MFCSTTQTRATNPFCPHQDSPLARSLARRRAANFVAHSLVPGCPGTEFLDGHLTIPNNILVLLAKISDTVNVLTVLYCNCTPEIGTGFATGLSSGLSWLPLSPSLPCSFSDELTGTVVTLRRPNPLDYPPRDRHSGRGAGGDQRQHHGHLSGHPGALRRRGGRMLCEITPTCDLRDSERAS